MIDMWTNLKCHFEGILLGKQLKRALKYSTTFMPTREYSKKVNSRTIEVAFSSEIMYYPCKRQVHYPHLLMVFLTFFTDLAPHQYEIRFPNNVYSNMGQSHFQLQKISITCVRILIKIMLTSLWLWNRFIQFVYEVGTFICSKDFECRQRWVYGEFIYSVIGALIFRGQCWWKSRKNARKMLLWHRSCVQSLVVPKNLKTSYSQSC